MIELLFSELYLVELHRKKKLKNRKEQNRTDSNRIGFIDIHGKPVACGKTIQYITEQGTIINHKQYSIQNRIQNVIHI